MRLDFWALLLAVGIVAGTVAPPLGVALLLASFIICAGVAVRKDLVANEWRTMALLGPLFVAGGVGIAFLHATAFDPLLEFAAIEPGEVVVVGNVVSPPVPTKVGQRADVRIEHLWYEDKEVLRGGGIQVYANDMRAGVGDRVQLNGDLKRPETKEEGFDYGRYLQTRGISGVVYAKGVWPADEERGWVGEVHRRTDAALGNGLRPREQAVVRGMVLGDSSRLPEEVEEAFQRRGITHVLAISGQHVAVLAAMIFVVLRLFAVPMLFRNPATLGLMWLYIFIAGAPPSALRAGVVATFVLAAPLFGRQLSPVH